MRMLSKYSYFKMHIDKYFEQSVSNIQITTKVLRETMQITTVDYNQICLALY